MGYLGLWDLVAIGLYFLAMLLIFTLFILVLIKFGVKRLLSAIIALSLFFTFYYVFAALALATAGDTDLAGLTTIVLSIGATVFLYKYPEWYVIDTLGILLCARKNHALVEYALAGMDNQLFVSKYQLHLPDRKQLSRQLERSLQEAEP